MNIGKLDTLVLIEKPGTARNRIGEIIQTWTIYCQLWVATEQKSGGESEESRQRVGATEVKLTAHYYAGITQGMRAYFRESYWDILSVDYSDRAKMVIECKMKDNQ